MMYPLALFIFLLAGNGCAFADDRSGNKNYSPFSSAQTIRAGDGSGVFLEAWGGIDRTTEWLVSTDSTGCGAARFYGLARYADNWGVAAAARAENGHSAVGEYEYSEVASGQDGSAWGANATGVTYSSTGNAHGIEVNGVNRSGSDSATVYGEYVVNGGNAQTDAGIIVETSLAESAGKPHVGLWLKENSSAVASDTGILIERVDSGEAFRTIAGQRIALTADGKTYIRFNPVTGKVEIVKNGVVVARW